MDGDVTNSVSKQSTDISWTKFIAIALAMDLVAFLFDRNFRPMRGVDPIEMVLWYLGYGVGFAVIPTVIVIPFVVVSKLKGKNTGTPKLTILSWGIGLLCFNLLMNAIKLL